MELPLKETPEIPRSDSTSSNQLFISEQFELPDDTFRMSLDYISEIGENVTVGDRDTSIDTVKVESVVGTSSKPHTPLQNESPQLETALQLSSQSPPIAETPKLPDDVKESSKNVNLLKLSLTKKESDAFVKPSPLAEVMSPAKMLQFEIDLTSSATPTMKRAAIDFNFFTDNTFEEYFKEENNEKEAGIAFKETPVIVKANTVRHEIGYGFMTGAATDNKDCVDFQHGRTIRVKLPQITKQENKYNICIASKSPFNRFPCCYISVTLQCVLNKYIYPTFHHFTETLEDYYTP